MLKKAPDNALLSIFIAWVKRCICPTKLNYMSAQNIDLRTHLLLVNEHFPVLVNSAGKKPYYH